MPGGDHARRRSDPGSHMLEARRLRLPSASPLRTLVLNAAGLPLVAELATGDKLTWAYDPSPDGAAVPPPFDESGVLERETYRELSAKEVAAEFGLASLPATIADLPLETVFSYDATTAKGTAYYAIWAAAEGRTIQLNLTPAVAPAEVLGLVDPGTLALQEGPHHVRIVATDAVLLRAAVAALRPASLDALPAAAPSVDVVD